MPGGWGGGAKGSVESRLCVLGQLILAPYIINF